MLRVKVDKAAGRTLQGLGELTAKQIQSELTQSGITFEPTDLKAYLLALLALSRLRIIDRDRDFDPELLFKVRRWCSSPALVLKKELGDCGIEKGPNRWFDIERLIRAQFRYESDSDGADDGEDGYDCEGRQHELREFKIESRIPSHSSAKVAKLPGVATVNFLITLMYADLVWYPAGFPVSCTECPVNNATSIITALNQIPLIRDNCHLTRLCEPSSSIRDMIVSWICSQFGTKFVEADDSGLKIPGFSPGISQFVLAKPLPAHEEQFAKHLKAARGKSTVLFHGTALRHLQSILRNGFHPAADQRFGPGLFMASNPGTPFLFTLKEAATTASTEGQIWPNTPFRACGVVLGCEVAGNGREVADGTGVHVITKLDSIAVRYVFIVPKTEAIFAAAPSRDAFLPAMTAAFKIIRKNLKSAAKRGRAKEGAGVGG